MAIRLPARPRTRPHIDMTPLIDCVFTLLIVLMLAATFNTPDSMDVNLPGAETIDLEKETPIVISLTADGGCFFNTDKCNVEELASRLKTKLAAGQSVVTIRGDEKASYQLFVQVLDVVKKSGARSVNISHR
jgi:biopolymer transport protein ExbD